MPSTKPVVMPPTAEHKSGFEAMRACFCPTTQQIFFTDWSSHRLLSRRLENETTFLEKNFAWSAETRPYDVTLAGGKLYVTTFWDIDGKTDDSQLWEADSDTLEPIRRVNTSEVKKKENEEDEGLWLITGDSESLLLNIGSSSNIHVLRDGTWATIDLVDKRGLLSNNLILKNDILFISKRETVAGYKWTVDPPNIQGPIWGPVNGAWFGLFALTPSGKIIVSITDTELDGSRHSNDDTNSTWLLYDTVDSTSQSIRIDINVPHENTCTVVPHIACSDTLIVTSEGLVKLDY